MTLTLTLTSGEISGGEGNCLHPTRQRVSVYYHNVPGRSTCCDVTVTSLNALQLLIANSGNVSKLQAIVTHSLITSRRTKHRHTVTDRTAAVPTDMPEINGIRFYSINLNSQLYFTTFYSASERTRMTYTAGIKDSIDTLSIDTVNVQN